MVPINDVTHLMSYLAPHNPNLLFQELAKLLEDQHGYIDLQNIPENKYYSMDKNPDEDEKL